MSLQSEVRTFYRSMDSSQDPVSWQELVQRLDADATVDLLPPRQRSYGSLLAAAVAGLALALVAVVFIRTDSFTDLPPPAGPSTPTDVTIEDGQIEVPATRVLSGTSEHRGGNSRNGYVDVSGPHAIDGYYWKVQTSGPLEATPLAFGSQLFIGNSEGTFYVVDQATGTIQASFDGGERASSSAAVGRSPALTVDWVVYGGEHGVVRGLPVQFDGVESWETNLGSRVRSSPVIVDGLVYIATRDGRIFTLGLGDGRIVSVWPSGTETVEEGIVADLSYADGVLYAGSAAGVLHVLDVTGPDPSEVCSFDARSPIVVAPVVDNDVVYVGTEDQLIWMLQSGTCDQAPGRISPYVAETPIFVAPAVVDGALFIAEGPYLYARDLTNNNEDLWPPGHVAVDSTITSGPVVTNDAIYFATEDGAVHAIDATTGDPLWTYQTGATIRGGVAVIQDAVFIADSDGVIHAIGPGPPSDE